MVATDIPGNVNELYFEQTFLDELSSQKAFKKVIQHFVSRDEPKEISLASYFVKRSPGGLHCTIKFCDYGKADGAIEYTQQDVVKKFYSKAFTLCLPVVMPRTMGAQVELREQQLLLRLVDIDKVTPSNNLPRGSCVHMTLACAAGVEPKQTGVNLLEMIQQEKGGSQEEEVIKLNWRKLYSLGNGQWMLHLAKKLRV